MNLENDFQFALKDGLGSVEAKKFNLNILNEVSKTAIAYSWENRLIYFLSIIDNYEGNLNPFEYLDLAKTVSENLDCFAVPDQKCGSSILWGSKSGNAVQVYRFKVFNFPATHFE